MKAPERIYIQSCDANDDVFVALNEKEKASDIEYIRNDLAEKMAKEFADKCLEHHCEFLLGNQERKDIEELFTGFIKSRKVEKE